MDLPTLTRSRQKEVARLARRRHRDASGEFLIEGLRSVESAVAARAPLREILVTPEAAGLPRVVALLAQANAPAFAVPPADMARLADAHTAQGVAAVAALRRLDATRLALPLLALDGVQDPGNVGAIVRAAAWFGASGVVCGPETADPFGPKAVRASMGGLWDLDLAEVDDLAGLLTTHRQQGVSLYGADLHGEPAARWRPEKRAILVLGSEAHGLSEAVRGIVNGSVRIEGGGRAGVESLNVSVAAGILLHRWLAPR